MVRFYIVPIERDTSNNARGPKYFKWKYDPDPPGIDCLWSLKDYGSVDMGVVAADIIQADHDVLVSNTDVYAFPEVLDDAMTQSDRGELLDYLELYQLPGDWIYAGVTFREALRIVTSMMLYNQRVCALMGYPADPYAGTTLNTQYRNMPTPLHDALQQAALELGYTWGSRNQDQLRKILKDMGDQWGSALIYFGFVML